MRTRWMLPILIAAGFASVAMAGSVVDRVADPSSKSQPIGRAIPSGGTATPLTGLSTFTPGVSMSGAPTSAPAEKTFGNVPAATNAIVPSPISGPGGGGECKTRDDCAAEAGKCLIEKDVEGKLVAGWDINLRPAIYLKTEGDTDSETQKVSNECSLEIARCLKCP